MIRFTFRLTILATAVSAAACGARMLIEDDTTGDDDADNVTPACPQGVIDAAICDVAEGEICAVHEPDASNPGSYTDRLCACWEASSSERRWNCYSNVTSPWECPASEPSTGFSCFGLYGAECSYPERDVCTCSDESGAWSCIDTGVVYVGQPPSSVPADQPIHLLSDAERADWCDWFATAHIGEGFPEPGAAPPDEEGYTRARGCSYGWQFQCLAMVPTISSDECEANLRLSTCEAPISELTDCVTTVYDSCWPAPHGCARYLERPGCSGTIAVSNDGFDSPEYPTGAMSPTGGELGECKIRIAE